MAEHTLGHAKESQQALDEFILEYAQGFTYGFAEVYAWRGEKDEAFEWLERDYQRRGSNLYIVAYDHQVYDLSPASASNYCV
jgi:hypothetical protein